MNRRHLIQLLIGAAVIPLAKVPVPSIEFFGFGKMNRSPEPANFELMHNGNIFIVDSKSQRELRQNLIARNVHPGTWVAFNGKLFYDNERRFKIDEVRVLSPSAVRVREVLMSQVIT